MRQQSISKQPSKWKAPLKRPGRKPSRACCKSNSKENPRSFFMNKSIVSGMLVFVAGASALMAQGAAPAGPKQPAPKSQAELTAVQALFQAQQGGPDAVIKAADELLTKFADTDFKEIALPFGARAYKSKAEDAKAQIVAKRRLDANPKNFQGQMSLGEIIVKG